MKKIALITSLIVMLIMSTFNVKSQSGVNPNPKEYDLIGKSIKTYTEVGTEFREFDTQRAKISIYIGTDTKKFIIIQDDKYIMGNYDVTCYTERDNVIKPEDVEKMLKKGKLDHYIFISTTSSNGNLYKIVVPYDKKYVEFTETENNINYKYSFDVAEVRYVAPQLPTMNKINNVIKN
jgi:hypothetical protein